MIGWMRGMRLVGWRRRLSRGMIDVGWGLSDWGELCRCIFMNEWRDVVLYQLALTCIVIKVLLLTRLCSMFQ